MAEIFTGPAEKKRENLHIKRFTHLNSYLLIHVHLKNSY